MIAILEKPAIVKELRAQNERIEAKVLEIVAENERLRAALERIVNLDYTRAGTNCCAYDAHKISKKALANRAEPPLSESED